MHSLEYLQSQVVDLFNRLSINDRPENLYKPIDYAMSQGGKRLRPLMALIGCELFGGKTDDVIPAAMGLEIFHNFTLLHDDIMDNAPIRRGMPTVYKKWGSNTAILSGDTMFVIAYEHITRSHPEILHDILQLFNQTAREVCEGQQLDMDFEKRKDVIISEYMEMIRLKTAVLIAGSLKAGAIAARASRNEQEKLYAYGINLGLSFQLMDDLLDTFGDEKLFGKKTGNDIVTNKKTYLYLKAYEKADNKMKMQLDEAFALQDNKLKVQRVLELFNQLNIRPETEMMIKQYKEFADNILEALNLNPEKRNLLNEVTAKLVKRKA
jgi:geranylgeranyl diphosphate synthase type II